MNKPRIAFYVHYHGAGHKHRTEAIAAGLDQPVDVLTSRVGDKPWHLPQGSTVVELECDIEDVPAEGRRRSDDCRALHYAPLWTQTIRSRVHQFACWIDQAQPDLVVVDVSAEISMLTRLTSTPQIVVRQHGRRDDAAHLAAYEIAESLIAPFPESMEDEITPGWVRNKTTYTSGFTRHGSAASSPQASETPSSDASASNALGSDAMNGFHGDEPPRHQRSCNSGKNSMPSGRRIVVMKGRGGSKLNFEHLRSMGDELGGDQIRVLGLPSSDEAMPENVTLCGWVDDPTSELLAADVVLTSAGHNSVMEMGQLRRRFIAIAEDRPFAEQQRKVAVLNREKLAVGLDGWPSSDGSEKNVSRWKDVLDRAMTLDVRRWNKIFDGEGVSAATKIISDVAQRSHECWKQATAASTHHGSPQTVSVSQSHSSRVRVVDRSSPISLLTIVRGRHQHLINQAISLSQSNVAAAEWIIVGMGEQPGDTPEVGFPVRRHTVNVDEGHLPLAKSRNHAASMATSPNLLFLDVDCIASRDLIGGMTETLDQHGGVWMGDVRYLPAGTTQGAWTLPSLEVSAVAHPLLPSIQDSQRLSDRPHHEFWSLCFGVRRHDFERSGGFDESFVGYGGEDTDFAFSLREHEISFGFVGYRAYHQYHDVCKPPLNHFQAILSNSEAFRAKWGRWPMESWLQGFDQMGLIDFDASAEHIDRLRTPTADEIANARTQTAAGF